MAQRSPQRPTAATKEPDEYDLKMLSGRMLARAFVYEDEADQDQLAEHEMAQALFRWLRRQDLATRSGLMVAHGLREG